MKHDEIGKNKKRKRRLARGRGLATFPKGDACIGYYVLNKYKTTKPNMFTIEIPYNPSSVPVLVDNGRDDFFLVPQPGT